VACLDLYRDKCAVVKAYDIELASLCPPIGFEWSHASAKYRPQGYRLSPAADPHTWSKKVAIE
jgi:hypothetical protein